MKNYKRIILLFKEKYKLLNKKELKVVFKKSSIKNSNFYKKIKNNINTLSNFLK